jgi:tetraacyldisaccharide 4'-kinase
LEALRGKRAFALSAIGNPAAFERSLQDAGMIVCGSRRFADHHAYQPHDLYAMTQTIIQWPAGAEAKPPEMVVTTEKDWVKLAGLGDVAKLPVPFLRIALELSFEGDGDTVVFGQVLAAIEAAERGRGS